jgi:hypothetical protein
VLKLKNIRAESNDYDPAECSVAGCNRDSDCIVATKRMSEIDLPLCIVHWEKYCEIPLEHKGENNGCKECKEAKECQEVIETKPQAAEVSLGLSPGRMEE